MIFLPDFVPPGTAWARLWRPDGEVLVRSVLEGGRRVVDQWRTAPLRALDRTVFFVGPERCVEAERYAAAGGPNLHPRPIPMPSRLRLGEEVAVLEARLRLHAVGEVEWEGVRIELAELHVQQGDTTRILRLGRGLGEVELVGFFRMVAFAGRFGEVHPPAALPDLPREGGGRPDGVF